METIIGYLEREQRTFDELAFSSVDSLVLSSLVYLNFDAAGVVERQSATPARLHDVVTLTPLDDLASSSWLADSPDTAAFVRAVMASRRYRDVEVLFYTNDLVSAVEKQFSAVTFRIPHAASALRRRADDAPRPRIVREAFGAPFDEDGLVYVAFRGTDGTLAGWKEDFNMTFKDVIPSQAAALQYLSGVASTCACPLIAGGHSKGGNLAEYSALTCDLSLFDRIVAVFDHDGPAFSDDPSPRIGEESFRSKLFKTVPSSSIFGLMLESRRDYRIVQSDARAFLSHSPFTWLIEEGDFVYDEKLTRGSYAFDRSLDEWMRSVDPAKRELFIDTMYDLLISTEATTWSQFQDNLAKNIATVLQRGRALDSDTRAFLLRTIASGVGALTSSTAFHLLPDGIRDRGGASRDA